MSSDREKMETPAVLWHYTIVHCLRSILAEGVIRPPTVGLAKNQKGVVWFSASPDWDPSANRWWRSPEGSLVEDFEFQVSNHAVHVINAPSPAATASLAIGEVVADKLEEAVAC